MHTLSSREILRLARHNELSLPLRHEWRKKTGWDPVNQERYRLHVCLSSIVWTSSLAAFFGVAIYASALPSINKDNWSFQIGLALSVAFGGTFVGVLWRLLTWLFMCSTSMHMVHERIGKPLSLFLHWINQTPVSICMKELSELREIAANVLRDLIGRHLNHLIDTPDPQDLGYAEWAGANADLAGEFCEKYGVLYRLGLVTESGQDWYEKVRAEREASLGGAVEPAASDLVPEAAEA